MGECLPRVGLHGSQQPDVPVVVGWLVGVDLYLEQDEVVLLGDPLISCVENLAQARDR